jgi:hypothetical protein
MASRPSGVYWVEAIAICRGPFREHAIEQAAAGRKNTAAPLEPARVIKRTARQAVPKSALEASNFQASFTDNQSPGLRRRHRSDGGLQPAPKTIPRSPGMADALPHKPRTLVPTASGALGTVIPLMSGAFPMAVAANVP